MGGEPGVAELDRDLAAGNNGRPRPLQQRRRCSPDMMAPMFSPPVKECRNQPPQPVRALCAAVR